MAMARSADGTPIGWSSTGSGPGLVVVHGGMESHANYTDLAAQLAGSFTVVVPDRRGRGSSGPHRPDHDLTTEVADLRAVLEATGARLLFGVSSGGVIALQAGVDLPGIERIAVYEPALDPPGTPRAATDPDVLRYEQAVAGGRPAEALVAILRATGTGPRWLRSLPRPLAAALVRRLLAADEADEPDRSTTLSVLVPTMLHDFRISDEGSAAWDRFGELAVPVLLLGGEHGVLSASLTALERHLPDARRATVPGAGHTAAGNRDDGGCPDLVARELRTFLAG